MDENEIEFDEQTEHEFPSNLFDNTRDDQFLDEEDELYSLNSLEDQLLNFRLKPPYPSLLTKKEYNARKTKLSFLSSDHSTKRVDAPYINIQHMQEKLEKSRQENKEESKQFKHYLKKKPYILMRDLYNFLSNTDDLMEILFETVDVLMDAVSASGSSLYIVKKASGEICKCPRPGIKGEHLKWKIESGTTVAAHVAYTKEYVMVDGSFLRDTRFPQGIENHEIDDEIIKSVMCVPMVTPQNTCYAVVELYRDETQANFEKNDLKVIIVATSWASAAIQQNKERLALHEQLESNNDLLNSIKCYFGDTITIDKLISDIMVHCKETLQAERGSFYIINKSRQCIEVEVFEEGVNSASTKLHKKNMSLKLDPNSILGLVARTGKSINVADMLADPRYDEEADWRMGVITRSLLCTPVKGVGATLGLVQVANKAKLGCFTAQDEISLQTFSLYWALALYYSNINKSFSKANKLNECYTDVLKYHLTSCCHEIEFFTAQPVVHLPKDFEEFTWYITPELYCWMPQYLMSMMIKIIGKDDIQMDGMIEFILSVQKGYRNNPYHCFEHAFIVCHCMYNILRRNFDSFTASERKALLIAALCHDIDHQGYTNNFLRVTNNVLAQLYEDSYLENHHYQITALLMQKIKIFKSITSATFKEILHDVKNIILGTDLTSYFRSRTKLIQIKQTTGFQWWNLTHRRLLKNLLITICDLSGQCKPFQYVKKITDSLYKEYYNEGDMEKAMDVIPLCMMDREKQHLVPGDQVHFLTVVVIPCAELLQTIIPNTERLLTEALNTRELWRQIIDIKGQRWWRQGDILNKL